MAILSGAAFETKYNDGTTGVYRDGQGVGSIDEGDHRSLVTDLKDSYQNILEDLRVPIDNSGTGTSIVIDFSTTNKKKVFYTNTIISSARTFSLTNDTYKPDFTLIFGISGTPVITFPASGWLMPTDDPRWNPVSRQWTPLEAGYYRLSASHNGTDWFVDISRTGYT